MQTWLFNFVMSTGLEGKFPIQTRLKKDGQSVRLFLLRICYMNSTPPQTKQVMREVFVSF